MQSAKPQAADNPVGRAGVIYGSLAVFLGVEIGGKMLEWPQLKLLAANPARKDVPGIELVWIEDKLLQFTIPDLPPGDYRVTIHDDKGPPGDAVYSVLETTAYLVFPPVWPFVLRSNEAAVVLRVLPAN